MSTFCVIPFKKIITIITFLWLKGCPSAICFLFLHQLEFKTQFRLTVTNCGHRRVKYFIILILRSLKGSKALQVTALYVLYLFLVNSFRTQCSSLFFLIALEKCTYYSFRPDFLVLCSLLECDDSIFKAFKVHRSCFPVCCPVLYREFLLVVLQVV